MKILVLTPYFFFPIQQDGLCLRVHNLFKPLQEKHNVSIITAEEFKSNTLSVNAYDLIYIVGWRLLRNFYTIEHPNTVVDFIDVPSLSMFQIMKAEKNLFKKTRLFKWWKDIISEERKWGKKFKNFVVISSRGKKELESLISKESNIIIIPNGVDTDYFKPISSQQLEEKSILFTGNMSYLPNHDAVFYFYRSIWPLVKKKIPELRFFIVGKDPSAKLMSIEKKDYSIIITGFVEDIRPFFEKATVYICPMRWGTGIRNKILEAWAMGNPIVATSASTEGLEFVENENILIADNPVQFADCIIELARDSELRKKIGQKGRELVEREYTWKSQSSKLESLFFKILSAEK